MSSPVTLIARREIVTRLQQKGYRIALLIALLIAVAAVLIPSFFGGAAKATGYDVGVVGRSSELTTALELAGEQRGVQITVHYTNRSAQARAYVKDEKWDAALLPDDSIVARHADDTVVPIVQSAYAYSRTVDALRTDGVGDRQILDALRVRPLAVEAVSSGENSQRQVIAIVTVVVLFSQLITFCTWVAMGVVEEKASRVVELLLSSVRPLQLLMGKLLGIGVLAAAQVAVLGGGALLTASIAKTVTLPASDLLTVLVSFVAFLLGYTFFAAVSAALASTVSRQEEVSGILAPVTVSLTLCYAAGFAVASNADSTFSTVLSIVPPVSAIAMPARIARGTVSAPDVVLAIVALLAVSAVVLALAARIYRASVLHTGSRLPLRQAWRGEAAATQR